MCMCLVSCILYFYTCCLHCTYLSISESNYQTGWTQLLKQRIDGINCRHSGEVNRRTGCNVGERSFSCDITNSMEREPESSLPCPQQPNICPIPESDKCSTHTFHPISWTSTLILSYLLSLRLPSVPLSSRFSIETQQALPLFPICATHIPQNSVWIWLPGWCLVRNTDHDAPHYEIFSRLL